MTATIRMEFLGKTPIYPHLPLISHKRWFGYMRNIPETRAVKGPRSKGGPGLLFPLNLRKVFDTKDISGNFSIFEETGVKGNKEGVDGQTRGDHGRWHN
jgi:hypothetical protein